MTTLLVIVDREVEVDASRLAASIEGSMRADDSVSIVFVAADGIPESVTQANADATLVMPANGAPVGWPSGVGARAPLVRFDLGERDRDLSPELAQHHRALGLDGLPFVIAAGLAAAEYPAVRVHYGDDVEQYFEWRQGAPGSAVAVLLHGGFYRSRWQAGLMEPLAVDLAQRGWSSANLEYRRPDRHGWDAMVADIHAGLTAIIERAPGSEIVLFGHSAGGQLALQLAEERAAENEEIVLAVSLAGLVDLVATHDRFMGEGAVAVALGGSPTDQGERYRRASPWEFAERRAPWLLVQGAQDSADLVEMNRRVAASARLGTPELIEAAGDHFSVIDPASAIWAVTIARVEELVASRRTLGG